MRRLTHRGTRAPELTLVTATVLFVMLCALLFLLVSLGEAKSAPTRLTPTRGVTGAATAQPNATVNTPNMPAAPWTAPLLGAQPQKQLETPQGEIQ